ncbi:MAG: Rieske 2Fe-2S domain-containing protein [Ignavibacteriales bacterium]|nr:Rieske 2Fe-2S domain-containing protein [Ignavibacteriales bacterium]
MNDEIKTGKSRREFLNDVIVGGVSAWLLAILYPVISYLDPPKSKQVKVSQVNIGKSSDFEINSGKIIRFGEKPVLVIKKSNGEYAAFLAECTHLNCTVQFRKDLGQIYCACHNGKYDLNGKVASGPPPAPLTKYDVAIKGEEVIVFKGEG